MPSSAYVELIEILKSMPDNSGSPFEKRRADFEEQAHQLPIAEHVAFKKVTVNRIDAEWFVPQGTPGHQTILYLHGGGYCIGSIDTHRSMISHIARAAGVRTLAINYRLAPENRFPAALEDSVTAYDWLVSQGIAAKNIVVAGDSAGGGLSVATLVKLKEKGIELPSAAVLLSPWVDLAITGESINSNADSDLIVSKEGLLEYASAYIGDNNSSIPLASPLYADLAGLPPLLIHAGSAEILLDDATRLTDRAKNDGVDVTLYTAKDMCHVWHYFAALIQEAMADIEKISIFVQEQLKR